MREVRKSRVLGICLTLILAILLAGCDSQPDVQPFTYNEPPWTAGEVALYTISEKGDEAVGTVRFDMIAGGRTVEPEDLDHPPRDCDARWH